MPQPFLLDAPDLPTAWKTVVPVYESKQYRPLVMKIQKWESKYALGICGINQKRAQSRWENYVDQDEMTRVWNRLQEHDDCSIRFGVAKPGRGYHKERGDFCLVGGAIDGRNLTVMYRSLELIGGFAYDLTLIDRLGLQLGISWKTVTFMAAKANIFALKRNSNEKLYPKLWRIFSAN
jgi:hypothetical protein